MSEEHEPIARRAYAGFADRYAAMAPTKPHNGLYERPASLALLGAVAGLKVLDAGCGPGIGSELLARQGAEIHGFDVTPEMVALAEQRCRGLAAEFRIGDLARPLDWLSDGRFDKILCSLVLGYIEELEPAFRELRRVAKQDARLVFSMSHPMEEWNHPVSRGDGSYFERRRYGMYWQGFGEPAPFVESYRHPLADILNALVDAGWSLERVVEPLPLPEMQAVDPRHYEELSRAPAFICISARA